MSLTSSDWEQLPLVKWYICVSIYFQESKPSLIVFVQKNEGMLRLH